MWKRIFYGAYEINHKGTIRRVKPASGTSRGRVLKPYTESNFVRLHYGKKVKQVSVRSLVEQHFR